MKKHLMWRICIAVLLAGCITALFGCAAQQPGSDVTVGDNEFRLSSLPELEPFEPFTDISSRYYEEYTDRLIPSDDYGRLYYYPGQVLYSDWMNEIRYGLCDAEGRIVMDPVCTYITIPDYEGAEIMQMSYHPTDITEDDMSNYDTLANIAYAALDGSWVVDDCQGYLQYADEEIFIINGVDYDDTYSYATNYVYRMSDGTLRTQFPHSWLIDVCADGVLLLKDQRADGSYDYRIADYDGNTLADLDFSDVSSSGGYLLAADDSGLWGLADLEGNYLLEPQYAKLTSTSWDEDHAGYFLAQTADMSAILLIDASGNVIWEIAGDADIRSLNDDAYPQLYQVSDWSQQSYYLIDIETGERGPALTNFITYIGNGWYTSSAYQQSLQIYRWGDSEPWLEFDDDNYVNAWMELLTDTEDIAAIQMAAETSDGSYVNYTLLYDLSEKKEIAQIDGVYYNYLDFGKGYVFSDPRTGVYNIYDDEGQLLKKTNFNMLTKIDDDHYVVTNSIYGGIIDSDGEWLIRININTLD